MMSSGSCNSRCVTKGETSFEPITNQQKLRWFRTWQGPRTLTHVLACDCKFRNDFRAQVGRGLNIAAERTNSAWKRYLESTKTLYVRTWSTWSSERVEIPQSLGLKIHKTHIFTHSQYAKKQTLMEWAR